MCIFSRVKTAVDESPCLNLNWSTGPPNSKNGTRQASFSRNMVLTYRYIHRNDGIEYTLRSEIRWRCYRNNNFIAAKMMINHSIFGYFPMLRHAWKNAHSGFGHRRCVVSLHVSAMRLFFLRLRRLIVSVSLKMLHEVILAGMGQW